ncbi:TenA family protein [Miltoncostaea marina]|uniref:TenA family protein n=1 Tax=Miltoncostaea marina TaxID=2843215 RepID=UPI001C3D3627|nr:TenA family protein [Miltoncostaea marina]
MSAAVVEGQIAPLIGPILRHPFITGLSDGTLPRPAFRRFLLQDGLFLRDYARALALAAARAGDSGDVRLLCRHAAEALDVERELHEHLTGRLGIGADEIAAAERSPTCLGYGSFLIRACAVGDRAEALAALAPCFLIYRRVGEALAAGGSPDPAYAEWIATYDGEAFGAATDELAGACARALVGLGDGALAAAAAGARTAARFEWMFWDAALRGEAWPVA